MDAIQTKMMAFRELIGPLDAFWNTHHIKWLFQSKTTRESVLTDLFLNRVHCALLNREEGEWRACTERYLEILREEHVDFGQIERVQRICWGYLYRAELSEPAEFREEIALAFEEWKNTPVVKRTLRSDVFENSFEIEIKKLSKYPQLMEKIVESAALQDVFFHWVCRCNGDVDLFALYPSIQTELISLNLGGDVSDIDVRLIEMQSGEPALLFDTEEGSKWFNLLDRQEEVTYRSYGFKSTVGEALQAYSKKLTIEIGNYDISRMGMTNWNAHFGFFDGENYHFPSLEEQDYWKGLPEQRRLSVEQAKEFFGEEIEEGKWGVSLYSLRLEENLNVDGAHSLVEIAAWDAEEKDYAVYRFGKLAHQYPVGAWQLAKFLFSFHTAAIACSDDAMRNMKRQATWTSVVMDDQAGRNVMERIKHYIDRGIKRNLAFQIIASSCIKWARRIFDFATEQAGIERKLPSLRIHCTKIENNLGLNILFFPAFFLPILLANLWISFVALCFAPWRKLVIEHREGILKTKRFISHKEWHTKEIEHPAKLHQLQIEQEEWRPKGKIQPMFLTNL